MQAVGKALREREQALLTVQALEAELRRKRKGIGSLEQEGSQVHSSQYSEFPLAIYSLGRGADL